MRHFNHIAEFYFSRGDFELYCLYSRLAGHDVASGKGA